MGSSCTRQNPLRDGAQLAQHGAYLGLQTAAAFGDPILSAGPNTLAVGLRQTDKELVGRNIALENGIGSSPFQFQAAELYMTILFSERVNFHVSCKRLVRTPK